MLFKEWDWELYIATQRKEGRAEGRAEGKAEMLKRAVRTMASSMQPDAIAAALKLPLSHIQTILSTASN